MMEEAQPVRRRIKELEVMVAEMLRETPDTTTLRLFTGNDRLEYQPGHFLTIDPHQFEALGRFTRYLEDQKGKKEPPRAYSLASAPHEKYLAITVKEEAYVTGRTPYPPLLSPILSRRTSPGARMVVTGFTGGYVLPENLADRTDHLIHVCAGSGIVPNYSILKHLLETGAPVRQTLLYTSKTRDDIIYRREIEALEAAHPDRLRVVHNLTRDPGAAFGERVRQGRLDSAVLTACVGDPRTALFYLCGPTVTPHDRQRAKAEGKDPAPRFLESALALLEGLGVPKDRIKRESYG